MTTAEAKMIFDGERAATEKLSPWWRAADIHAIYPASTADAVALLRNQEYDVTEATVAEFIDCGYIPQPARKSGRLIWWALDIVQFLGALEFRRRWQPLSKIHDWKKSQFARSVEQAESVGRSAESVFEDLRDFTVNDLLSLLVRADDRTARECFFEAILLKLGKS